MIYALVSNPTDTFVSCGTSHSKSYFSWFMVHSEGLNFFKILILYINTFLKLNIERNDTIEYMNCCDITKNWNKHYRRKQKKLWSPYSRGKNCYFINVTVRTQQNFDQNLESFSFFSICFLPLKELRTRLKWLFF